MNLLRVTAPVFVLATAGALSLESLAAGAAAAVPPVPAPPAAAFAVASGSASSALDGVVSAGADPSSRGRSMIVTAGDRRPAGSSGVRGAVRSGDPAWESVVVTGTGEVLGEPDTLSVDFGVETAAATVGTALDQALKAATRMRDALVRAGVARADLQTTNVSVTSTTDDSGKVTGYSVSQGLSATIRDLPKAGPLMTAAITAGGDAARLNGVSFAIEKNATLIADARKKAFTDARSKAELYARAAGRPLGRVVKINEAAYGFSEPGQRDTLTTSLAFTDLSVPIEPGRQRLSATITVEWLLGPPAEKR